MNALELADLLEAAEGVMSVGDALEAAAMLRSQHEAIKKLRVALERPVAEVPKERVREIFMNHGFTIKGGQTDLKPYVYNAAYALLNEAPQPAQQPPQTTCNCRWEGDVQVQQCTLHEAHVASIHEWAERAKSAEKKLKEVAPKPAQQADTRTTAIQSCIDRLIFGGQPAAAQILRHHFAKDLGEE